jgi:triacylglycerol esterase/lipase EstA (alpha/beta hydrolase family)
MRTKPLAATLLAVAMAATAWVGSAGTADAVSTVDPQPWALRQPLPGEDNTLSKAVLTSFIFPYRAPLGANDWNCRPSPAHPEPVVLVHGTVANMYNDWNGLSPILKAQGYCVFALNYGHSFPLPPVNATGDMVSSAYEIRTFVNRVLASTGARHVALIGHSQGGAQARYVANLLLPSGVADKVIALAPTNHPTTLNGVVTFIDSLGLKRLTFGIGSLIGLPGVMQQGYNSPFYVALNGKGETVPGIDYTVIATRYDTTATPYTIGFLTPGPGAVVHNLTLQDSCPADRTGHGEMSYNKNVAQLVLNALDPAHPHRIQCY